MHLLMMTYRQDIFTNFGCVHDRSSVSFFREVFRISVLINRSFHAKEQCHYSIIHK